jgi:hypothetical protein
MLCYAKAEGQQAAERTRALGEAYALLGGTEDVSIEREKIEGLFDELNHYRGVIERIDKANARLLFSMLDCDGDGEISRSEFERMCGLLAVRFKRVKNHGWGTWRPSFLQPDAPFMAWLTRIVLSPGFEVCVYGVLVLNAVELILWERNVLSGSDTVVHDRNVHDGRVDSPLDVLEVVITIVFGLELAAKLAVLGWHSYTRSLGNLFDGIVTVITVAATIYIYAPSTPPDERIARYLSSVRLGRLLRLFGAAKQVQIVVATFVRLLPQA